MKILIVEDSVIIRQRLRRMLAVLHEAQVTGEVGDARQATAVIQQTAPDVILLDIHLDNGSGIDVLVEAKKRQPAPAVIVLTNYPYPQYRQRCLQAGADYFFVKSTEFEQVVPALRQLAQRTGGSADGAHAA